MNSDSDQLQKRLETQIFIGFGKENENEDKGDKVAEKLIYFTTVTEEKPPKKGKRDDDDDERKGDLCYICFSGKARYHYHSFIVKKSLKIKISKLLPVKSNITVKKTWGLDDIKLIEASYVIS